MQRNLLVVLSVSAALACAACQRAPAPADDAGASSASTAATAAPREGCVLHLVDGWMAAAPPVAPVRAGYLTVHNAGDTPARIDGASSPAFGRVELHATDEDGDVSRMRRVEALELAPGETLALAPGGMHLMLMDPAATPVPATVEVVLEACGEAWAAPLTERGDVPAAAQHQGH